MNIPLLSKSEYSVTIEDVHIKLNINHGSTAVSALVGLTEHTHAYSELFVCLEGTIVLEMGGESVTLSQGDAAIVPMHLSHHKREGRTGRWYAVGFSVESAYGKRKTSLGRSLLRIGEESRVFRDVPVFCEGIERLCQGESGESPYLPALRFALLLTEIAEQPPSPSPSTDSDMSRLTQLENLISGSFMERLSQGQVAQALHISPRQLSRICARRYGKTFTQVILEKRLETAVKLLTTTDRCVDQIAADVGFATATSFYRSFKARYGATPAAYRRENCT